jgi:hypothetical protein
MTTLGSFDLLVPPVLTLIGSVLGYLWCRTVRRGKPVSSIQRNMLFYFAVFILGMTYAMALHGQIAALLHWQNAWVAAILVWSALLSAIAWIRYRRDREKRPVIDE